MWETVVANDLPASENIFFFGCVHIVNDLVFAASALRVGKEADVVEPAVEDPIHNIPRLPIGIDGKGSAPCPKKDRHILDSSMINVGVEFSLRIKAHVTALVLDDEPLKIQMDRTISANNDVRTDAHLSIDVPARIL